MRCGAFGQSAAEVFLDDGRSVVAFGGCREPRSAGSGDVRFGEAVGCTAGPPRTAHAPLEARARADTTCGP